MHVDVLLAWLSSGQRPDQHAVTGEGWIQQQGVTQPFQVIAALALNLRDHLRLVGLLPLICSEPRVLSQHPQVVHNGVHVSGNDLVEIFVDDAVHLKFVGELVACGLGLVLEFHDVKAPEAMLRINDVIVAGRDVRGPHFQHADDDFVSFGRPKQHVTHRVACKLPQRHFVAVVEPIRMPDVAWSPDPCLEICQLVVCFRANDPQLRCEPIFDRRWNEPFRIPLRDRKVFDEHVAFHVHGQLNPWVLVLGRHGAGDAGDDGFALLEFPITACNVAFTVAHLVLLLKGCRDLARVHLDFHRCFGLPVIILLVRCI
mmetsp:Transcript_11118/g.39324  ORF Transcript_11118/g.39324 Transcript_11118/m.39324 type:complete len:314 (-) Transcript_11118:3994-4935(-)